MASQKAILTPEELEKRLAEKKQQKKAEREEHWNPPLEPKYDEESGTITY